MSVSSSPSGERRTVTDVTCLGCGCACDDIAVTVAAGSIAEAANACPLGVAWFGDGRVPADAFVGEQPAPLSDAVRIAAAAVRGARRPLLYLAPGLSCEAQREAVALADAVGAALDSATSDTALGAILAAQERGRASATLGEARHRADVVVWWGVDPERTHPRFATRYAPAPRGLGVPEGRRSRTVISVDVGPSRAGAGCDRRFSFAVEDELVMLTALRAIVSAPDPRAAIRGADADPAAAAIWARARELGAALLAGRYVLVVADAELPSGGGVAEQTARWSALIALAQALNGPTRGALTALRGSGNLTGADAVLTSHTGYPLAVDFSHGVPRYRPFDGTASQLAARGEIDVVMVVGNAGALPPAVDAWLTRAPGVLVGPRATLSRRAPHLVAIDTGVAGVHEGGTALRLDDVPLPLRVVMPGPPAAAAIVRAIREAAAGAGAGRGPRRMPAAIDAPREAR